MAATSHGVVAGMMHMYEVSCLLCAVKLDDKASRINVRGRSSFPIETELRKLPLKLAIDDNTRLCFPCLRKLKKKKSLEENFAAASEEIMRNYGKDLTPTDFVPSFASTPTKSAQTSIVGPTTCTSLAPHTFLQPQPTPQHKKDTEPGVTVSCSFFLFISSLFLFRNFNLLDEKLTFGCVTFRNHASSTGITLRQ